MKPYGNMRDSLNLNCLAGFLSHQQYDPTYNYATCQKNPKPELFAHFGWIPFMLTTILGPY